MDITENVGLEFLDFTDVDEYEKNVVLSSLQSVEANVKFPWFIGDDKSTNEGIKVTKPLPDSSLEMVSNDHIHALPAPITLVNPENGLIIPINNKPEIVANPGPVQPGNPQYFSHIPQYYAPPTAVPTIPVHIAPQNYPSYPSNTDIPTNSNIYPYISPPYPIKPSVYYGVPPAQPIFVSHPATPGAGNFYQNTNAPYVPNPVSIEANNPAAVQNEEWKPQENLVQDPIQIPPVKDIIENQNIPKNPVSPLSADSPAFTPKHQQYVESKDPAPQVQDTGVKIPVAEPQIDKKSSPVMEKEPVAPKQGAWGSERKSWASLFSAKEGSVNSPVVNGVNKSAFPEALNKESNNNASCPIKNPKRNHFIDPDCYRMGEFLAKYSVDGRAISLQPRGLINQSNYCYINSILQALIACPPMYNLLNGLAENISSNAKRKPTPVIDGMCKFVKEYKHLPANMRVSNRRSEGGKKDPKKEQGAMINTDIPFEPSWIYKILHGLQTDLMEGRQEDAEEFLGCLLNNLSDEMQELIKLVGISETQSKESEDDESWQVMGNKNKGSIVRKTEYARTPITDIFGGSLKSKIHRIGGQITENTQPFLTLQLNIEKVNTVREALEGLITKNQLEGLTSAKTNEEVEAWQQVLLDELPVVLILHLKCFDFKLDGCTKIVRALEFPIDLKIDTKLLSSKTTDAKAKQYKLFAVVYHDGKEATKGHYVTDAFHVGYSSWLRYDDASVKPVQEEQVLNPQGTRVPYLLFYRRSDTIRSR